LQLKSGSKLPHSKEAQCRQAAQMYQLQALRPRWFFVGSNRDSLADAHGSEHPVDCVPTGRAPERSTYSS